jgi:hypothetical protein
MSADRVEELHVQYWRLSKLDNLEMLYHEAEYSLSLLLRIHSILKDKRITKDKDISDLIELANDGLPNLRARFEVLLNQITALENEKNSLSTEILGLKNSLYTNNEIINCDHWPEKERFRLSRALFFIFSNSFFSLFTSITAGPDSYIVNFDLQISTSRRSA